MRDTFISGLSIIAAFLGLMSILAVLAFHYPEYLTTPQLRAVYEEHQVRLILYIGMIAATLFGVIGLFAGKQKRTALFGLTCLLLAWLAGGSDVPLDGPVRTASFYLSLDWVLLDLLLIATLFVSLERINRLKPVQPILREDWQIDLAHYVANHIFNGGMILLEEERATIGTQLREALPTKRGAAVIPSIGSLVDCQSG